MAKRKRQKTAPVQKRSSVAFLTTQSAYDMLCCEGYTRLDKNPEVVTACRKVATLIASMTIYLMANGEKGDIRIKNELSRHVDITPNRFMNRTTWMETIVMNMLLYGSGNSVVYPTTENGLLSDMVPLSPSMVSFRQDGYGYKILINGTEYDPENLLHFVYNPDPEAPWMGKGLTTTLRDVANNIKQARHTEDGFMKSKWKPSVIVKVDGMTEEFSSPAGRKKLLESYVESSEVGEPWLIPAEQFSVDQIRPLSLQDLAIIDTMKLDQRTIAAIIGVPAFVLGVGEYDEDEWNNFVATTIQHVALIIQQELTRKLLISTKWYFQFNIYSLYRYSFRTIADVYGSLRSQGIVTGNEVRDQLGLAHLEGLDQLVMLENYIPTDRLGDQKKLKDGGTDDGKDE